MEGLVRVIYWLVLCFFHLPTVCLFFFFHTTPTNTFTVNGAIHRTQGGVEPSIERCLGLTALAKWDF